MKPHDKKQAGVVLVISLIMLVLLTIIGITAMQVTNLEEKMAGNSKEYNTAFQAAETTLRNAEAYIDSLATLGDFTDTLPGFLSEGTVDPDYKATTTWSSANSAAGPTISGVITPRYIIKHVGAQGDSTNTGLTISGYGESLAGSAVTLFRVTSSSTGSTDQSRVVLQSYYGKRF